MKKRLPQGSRFCLCLTLCLCQIERLSYLDLGYGVRFS